MVYTWALLITYNFGVYVCIYHETAWSILAERWTLSGAGSVRKAGLERGAEEVVVSVPVRLRLLQRPHAKYYTFVCMVRTCIRTDEVSEP